MTLNTKGDQATIIFYRVNKTRQILKIKLQYALSINLMRMTHDDPLFQERLGKLERIKAMKMNPYPARFDRTHDTQTAKIADAREVEAIEKNPKKDIQVAGRIMTLREHGKLIFAQIQDQEGQLQVCWMRGFTPDAVFDFVKLLDLGDFIGLTGDMFITKHGEPTVLISECQLLSKSLRPLPDKWHGLKDREKCYRDRYLDMVMNPETRKRFLVRSRFIQTLRDFYYEHGFVEIETPILENVSSGATAKPFTTHHNALDIDVYLRIAGGELWQKTAVVGGFERTFEIGRVFRNEGMDPSHLQEFTMVEHYAAYWNYEDNMNFTEQMFEHLLKTILGTTQITIKNPDGKDEVVNFNTPWPRVEFYSLIKKDSGIDVHDFDNADDLCAVMKKKGIVIEEMDTMGFGSLVDHLYKKVSRPKLIQPTFVIRHPVDMKPLARKSDDNSNLCDTFQLLVNGWEVINAYGEIVDPIDQRERFENQARAKAEGDEEAMSMNEEYLRCMEHGMPPMSGWGMGIDRLLTLLTHQDNLRDLVLFPLMRPSGKTSNTITPDNQATAKDDDNSRSTMTDDGKNIEVGISYDDAVKLLDEYVKNPVNRNHSRESEVVMRGLAKRLGANEEAWGILGLLHDIDWETVGDDVVKHCVTCEEILKKAGVTDGAIRVIQSHGYELGWGDAYYGPGDFKGKTRASLVEHALAAGETITGLIYAYGLMRPDKKLANAEVKSIKKKLKDKTFAAKVNRNTIQECEKLGLEVDEFLQIALDSMKEIAEEIGL